MASCAVAAPTNSQGNLLSADNKPAPKRELRRTPSTLFAWPTFVTNATAAELVAPLKSTLVQVRANDTVRSALWSLIKSKVSCVPVYNDAARKYVGYVDMFDLVQYIAKAAGPSAVKPDFFQVFKRQSYGDSQISKITSAQSRDNCTYVSDFSQLSDVFEKTVASNLPRIPVMSKHKIVGMISQGEIVKYLSQNKEKFEELASKTVAELCLVGTDNVYTVEEGTLTVNAFSYMSEKGVQGLAVVNADGKFVDAIHSFDAKGLVHGDAFSDLRQPVLRYLSKTRILLNKNLDPVMCTEEDTLANVLDKMATEGIYRVFIVDAEQKPVSVVSLRDILKAMHCFVPAAQQEAAVSTPVGGGAQ